MSKLLKMDIRHCTYMSSIAIFADEISRIEQAESGRSMVFTKSKPNAGILVDAGFDHLVVRWEKAK